MCPSIILPSFPAASWSELETLLQALHGVATSFQIDLVDGQFVPHTSWPFTESDPVTALSALEPWSQVYLLEIDCMVKEPLQYLDAIVATGARRVIVHYTSTDDLEPIFAHHNLHDYRLGIALINDTPLSVLDSIIDEIDYVQLMGIAAIGQQGQPFDDRTIERVRSLRQKYPELEIAVDGGVNRDTIPRLLAAGVDRFAPGSAITKAADPIAAYKQLAALVG